MNKSALSIIAFFLAALAASASWAELSDVKLGDLKRQPPIRWGRDPFVKYEDRFKKPGEPIDREKDLALVKISGIISDGKKALAIANGEFLRPGDMIAGFKILAVSGDKILLEKEGRKFYLGIDRFAVSGKR